MTEQQKERLDKQGLLAWVKQCLDASMIYKQVIRQEVYTNMIKTIVVGTFDANDSEAIKGWGECESQNQQMREELSSLIDRFNMSIGERDGARRAAVQIRKESEQMREELERVQLERDAWKENADQCLNHRRQEVDLYRKLRDEKNTLRSELAAKDKALQMIANAKVHSCDSAYQLTQIAQQAIGVTHET